MIEFITLVFVLLSIGSMATDLNTGVNEGEFMELCSFTKILEKQPEYPKVTVDGKIYDPSAKINTALELIDLLNATTADDITFEQLKEGADFEKAKDNTVVNQVGKLGWGRLLESYKKLSMDSGEGSLKIERPANARERKRAHGQIGKLYEKARRLKEKFDILGNEIQRSLFEARKAMLSAIYGKKVIDDKIQIAKDKEDPFVGIQATVDSFGGSGASSYDNICNGGSAADTDTYLGKSILSDMMCLCTRASANAQAYCGATRAPGSAVNPFNAETLVGFAAKFKGWCDTAGGSGALEPAPETLGTVVARHRAMLGRNRHHVSSPDLDGEWKNAQFILGFYTVHADSGPKCDGSSGADHTAASKGVCVNYAAVLNKGGEIPWIAEVQNAAAKLKEGETKFNLQLSFLSKMENLKNAAEIYYENSFATQAVVQSNAAIQASASAKEGTNSTPLAAGATGIASSTTLTNLTRAIATALLILFNQVW